jgi:hypothetical protein
MVYLLLLEVFTPAVIFYCCEAAAARLISRLESYGDDPGRSAGVIVLITFDGQMGQR